MATNDDQKPFNYALLPPELLQVVGSRLCTEELHSARLVCKGWARALAHCMPAVTVALPRQASDRIFRQPLVLCSSGVLNSAQCQDYSAVPRSCPRHESQQLLGRRRSCRNSQEGGHNNMCKRTCISSTCSSDDTAACSHAVKPSPVQDPMVRPAAHAAAAPAAETQPTSRDKPSPFATEMGQAVLDCLLVDPIMTATRAAASAATTAAALAAGTGSKIPTLPRSKAIKAAISMPPMLVELAHTTQEQEAVLQPDQLQMRKLASVPASNARLLPLTKTTTKQGMAGTQQQPEPVPHHVVTTVGPVIQGWSSLPSAGLRTCSSLKQLNLKLSGAPPSPADLMDLSKLMHLTHLSFKQVDLPDTDEMHMPAAGDDLADTPCSSSSSSSDDDGASSSSSSCHCDATVVTASISRTASESAPAGCRAAMRLLKRSHSVGPVKLQPVAGVSGEVDLAAAASALEGCHLHSPEALAMAGRRPSFGLTQAHVQGAWGSCTAQHGSGPTHATACPDRDDVDRDQGGLATSSSTPDSMDCGPATTQSMTCSVITVEHVKALAHLPFLSSLELAPKHGVWDAAGQAALLHLTELTGLTRLSICWGDAAAATAPLSSEDAAAAAQGQQLPLQRCLAGLTTLRELSINGAAVVDVAVLQRLQRLRSLTGEGLQVVNSDVMAIISSSSSQEQQAEASHPAGPKAPVLSAATDAPAEQQQQQGGRWVSLPDLQHVHAVHPASDISLLLQLTVTPQLSHLGFVTRGPSDFARLLGQHGKLCSLHLAFAEEESWHPIAVVRLPTALPCLHSLTIDGGFWLPNSLIVALGVMEVPLEHLSLTCRLAPTCLQRLQHLKKLKRLALHHVPSKPVTLAPRDKVAKGPNDGMLQLPAKLLPPQLQELEISNGWILH